MLIGSRDRCETLDEPHGRIRHERQAAVRFEVEDGIGVITIDNPPVNALGPGVRDGIVEALEKGEADPASRPW